MSVFRFIVCVFMYLFLVIGIRSCAHLERIADNMPREPIQTWSRP